MKAILQWVLRTMMKDQTGVMRTLPKKDLVNFNVAMTAERLMRNGFDPNAFKNANQVENAINQIEAPRNVQQGITTKKSADVFDLEGRKIDTDKGIMGGTQIPDDDLPPLGSRGGPDDIAAPVQSAEETIKNMIEAENKKGIANIQKRILEEDREIENLYGSAGFGKDQKVDAEFLAEYLAENAGKVYDDLPTKERLDFYNRAFNALTRYKRTKGTSVIDEPKKLDPRTKEKMDDMKDIEDPEDMAQGGRAGFSKGSTFKTIFNFLNENNPVQAYKKYLESVKTRMKQGKEAEVAGEVVPIAAGGALITNQMKKILKKMNEEQKKRIEEEAQEELRKDMKKADGGRIGYFMGSANPKGLGLLRAILNYMSKKGIKEGRFKGADLSGLDMLRFSNPKRLNKLLEDVRGKVNVKEGIMGTDSVKAMQQADIEKRKGITAGALEVAKDMKARDIKIKRRVAEEAENTIIPRIKKQLMEDMGMSEEAAEKAARNMAEAAQNIRLTDDPPIITKEGLLQLENVLKNMETGGKKARDLNADGGRIGLKNGMDRRTFMKIMAGLTALPVLGKFFKGAKVASKAAPIIKTPNAPGKPEWFDALVTKVVNEGTDVTKGFATKERELVHTKQISDFAEVTVYRDLDTNTTIVNYGSKLRKDPTKPYERGNIQRAVNDPDQIDLVVKGAEDIEPTIIENERGFVRRRGSKSSAEFEAYESEPRVVNYDGDMEFDGTNVVNNVDDLNEDVSILKEYATGKKLTPEEAAKAKKKREDYQKFLEDPVEQANYLENKYGPGPEPDDYASGGIAKMLGE